MNPEDYMFYGGNTLHVNSGEIVWLASRLRTIVDILESTVHNVSAAEQLATTDPQAYSPWAVLELSAHRRRLLAYAYQVEAVARGVEACHQEYIDLEERLSGQSFVQTSVTEVGAAALGLLGTTVAEWKYVFGHSEPISNLTHQFELLEHPRGINDYMDRLARLEQSKEPGSATVEVITTPNAKGGTDYVLLIPGTNNDAEPENPADWNSNFIEHSGAASILHRGVVEILDDIDFGPRDSLSGLGYYQGGVVLAGIAESAHHGSLKGLPLESIVTVGSPVTHRDVGDTAVLEVRHPQDIIANIAGGGEPQGANRRVIERDIGMFINPDAERGKIAQAHDLGLYQATVAGVAASSAFAKLPASIQTSPVIAGASAVSGVGAGPGARSRQSEPSRVQQHRLRLP